MDRVDRIKAWRKEQHEAGKPCDLADYYRTHPQDKREQERDEQVRRERIKGRLKSLPWLR